MRSRMTMSSTTPTADAEEDVFQLGQKAQAREKARFRNCPFRVKSLVSTSPILGAPRERAHESAVASAAPAIRFRCLHRRFLASVRGRHRSATSCHQRKQRAYLKTRGQTKIRHLRANGFTGSIVPAMELRAEQAFQPLRILFPSFSSPRRRAPPSSSGNPSRRSTCDAKSRRSCAPARP